MREPSTYEQSGKITQTRNSPGNRQSANAQRHVTKRWISAEELIATQPGNRHFQSKLSRCFADEPGVEAIDRRLIHCFENFWQIFAKLLLRHDPRRVSRPVARRYLRSDRGLILTPPAKLFEGHCHCLDLVLSRIAHQTD